MKGEPGGFDLGSDLCAEGGLCGAVEIECQGHVIRASNTSDDALGMKGAGVEKGSEEAGNSGRDVANLRVADIVDADGVRVVLDGVSGSQAIWKNGRLSI